MFWATTEEKECNMGEVFSTHNSDYPGKKNEILSPASTISTKQIKKAMYNYILILNMKGIITTTLCATKTIHSQHASKTSSKFKKKSYCKYWQL